MTEPQKNDGRPLSLIESFKLYVWTMWKAGWHSDTEVAHMLGVLDRLTELAAANLEVYKNEFSDSVVQKEVAVEPAVEAVGEASSQVPGGSSDSSN
jgi:hypothetical protein